MHRKSLTAGLIGGLLLLLTNFIPAQAPAQPDRTAFLAALDQAISEKVRSEDFSGTVLIGLNEEILFRKAYGRASLSFDVPNQITTRFNLGSVNKIFTAIAIARLEEQGRLDYQDTVDKYLDSSWINPEFSGRIRISHLLTHTSGLGDFFNDVFWNTPRDFYKAVDDYKSLNVGQKLEFEPGTSWRYSNFGFILLGAIIEKVSGETYSDYVRRNIYEPCGMGGTGEFDLELPIPNLAVGYQRVESENGRFHWENNLFKHLVKGGPGGGGFSTVDDLFNFSMALRRNILVTPETLARLYSENPGTGDEKNVWGYGFIVRRDPDLGRITGHSGGFFGIDTCLWMYQDTGFTVVILSNYGNGAKAITAALRQCLLGLNSVR